MGSRLFVVLVLVLPLWPADIFTPIPSSLEYDEKKAKLGKQLFFDPRLSRDGTITCASCHRFQHGGAEPRAVSEGIDGQVGQVNAPTVFNAVFNIDQFWDGRAPDLVEQAKGPIENPIEMGHDLAIVVAELKEDTDYVEAFARSFPDRGLTSQTIAEAIAEYEKTLITPDSPLDRYLKGDKNALSTKAREGMELFKNKGCVACHHGINIGGNQYQRFGAVIENDSIGTSHPGRFNVTGEEEDRHYLKVPSLRNVAETSPYFHTGEVKSLSEAVRLMGYHQLGLELTDDEIRKIVAFLNSLSGTLNEAD